MHWEMSARWGSFPSGTISRGAWDAYRGSAPWTAVGMINPAARRNAHVADARRRERKVIRACYKFAAGM
jgi:hypothetical protein